MENKMEIKYLQGEDDEFISYYCAINEPIAEIVILDYFTKFAKVEKVKNLFADDFSVNYKIEIPADMIDLQCLLCFMFMNQYITSPATFGVVLSDVFDVYSILGMRTDIQ